jgi:hypothetical protein
MDAASSRIGILTQPSLEAGITYCPYASPREALRIHQGAGQLLYCGYLKGGIQRGHPRSLSAVFLRLRYVAITYAQCDSGSYDGVRSITPTLAAHRTHLPEQLSCHDEHSGRKRCDPAKRVDELQRPWVGKTALYHDELLKRETLSR